MVTASPIQNSRLGTCPHGLPMGACPICNGMGGGGAKRADHTAKPGEMSWNQCAAIGAFLKAQQEAKVQKQQDFENLAQRILAFNNAMISMGQKIANLSQVISNNFPPIIAKPVNFILNTIIGGVINIIRAVPMAIVNFVQNFGQKIADISDKLAAVFGELKAAVEEKISKAFGDFKKKVKSLFSIFKPLDADNNDKQIDETKRTFELRTFIHDLYKKLTNQNEGTEDEH